MGVREFFRIEGKEVAFSNLDKVYFPDIGATKAELLEYYIQMAPHILPHLAGRPFSMLCYPDGIYGKAFYRKRRPEDAPGWLRSARLPSGENPIDWCLVDDLAGLAYMVNRSCIETHAWFSALPDLDRPDMAVLDLDPSGGTGFPEAAAAALLVKTVLDACGLQSLPKLSGKTGVHVMVPIEPAPYERIRGFLKAVCSAVARADPGLCTTQRAVARRGDRVYLDAAQFSRGKTLPSPYSVRATPQACVSAPVTWEELAGGVRPERFTMRSMAARMRSAGDLLAPLRGLRQALPPVG